MAIDLSLDQDSDDLIPEFIELPVHIHKEMKRRIWWMVYIYENFMTSRMNLSSWIRTSEMNVPLPSDESIWEIHQYIQDRDQELVEIALITSEEDFQGGATFEKWNTGFIITVCFLASFFYKTI
jgi:hypothetical protein